MVFSKLYIYILHYTIHWFPYNPLHAFLPPGGCAVSSGCNARGESSLRWIFCQSTCVHSVWHTGISRTGQHIKQMVPEGHLLPHLVEKGSLLKQNQAGSRAGWWSCAVWARLGTPGFRGPHGTGRPAWTRLEDRFPLQASDLVTIVVFRFHVALFQEIVRASSDSDLLVVDKQIGFYTLPGRRFLKQFQVMYSSKLDPFVACFALCYLLDGSLLRSTLKSNKHVHGPVVCWHATVAWGVCHRKRIDSYWFSTILEAMTAASFCFRTTRGMTHCLNLLLLTSHTEMCSCRVNRDH